MRSSPYLALRTTRSATPRAPWALGWRTAIDGQRSYLPLQDDISSTAFSYQSEPHAPFSELPDANGLEGI